MPKNILLGVLLVFVVVLGSILWGSKVLNLSLPDAVKSCEEIIKSTLKSPSSYKRISYEDLGDSIRIEFDASNEYGALIRANETCLVSGDKGSSVELEPYTFYHEFPQIIGDLKSSDKDKQQTIILKLTVSFYDKSTEDVLIAQQAKINSAIRTYLQATSVEEVNSVTGMYRLREEFLLLINRIVKPAKVNDVLFRVMDVQ